MRTAGEDENTPVRLIAFVGDNPLQSMTILQEQEWENWMSNIKREYPGIEIIVK